MMAKHNGRLDLLNGLPLFLSSTPLELGAGRQRSESRVLSYGERGSSEAGVKRKALEKEGMDR